MFRLLNRIYAFFFGYFWLPCPLCGRYFGGHEVGDGGRAHLPVRGAVSLQQAFKPMFRKHVFVDPGQKPLPEAAPNWVGYRCIFCGERSGLDAWQIRDMPKDMARCPFSKVRASLFEWLCNLWMFSGINCLWTGEYEIVSEPDGSVRPILRRSIMKRLLAPFLLLVFMLSMSAGCCPKFSDQTMQAFQALETNTAAREQGFRVRWAAKITANLKAGGDKVVILQYLGEHSKGLKGIADTAKQLNIAAKAQRK